jgi:hypothetical protein
MIESLLSGISAAAATNFADAFEGLVKRIERLEAAVGINPIGDNDE